MTNANGKMPVNLALPFEEMHQGLCNLYLEWSLFRELFAHSEERIALLNKTAETLFGSLQRLLQDWVYLGITRMTDPAKTGSHENLTLRQLVEILRVHDPALYPRAEVAVANAEQVCSAFRDHRNKRIAHSDLPSAMARTYTRPSRQSVEDALKSIADAMNVFHRHYDDVETGYKHVIFRGGGNALDSHLRAAVYFHELRRKVLLGEISGDSLMNELTSYRN